MKDPRVGSPCGIKAFLVDDEILHIQMMEFGSKLWCSNLSNSNHQKKSSK
jgi:hypothetical protein